MLLGADVEWTSADGHVKAEIHPSSATLAISEFRADPQRCGHGTAALKELRKLANGCPIVVMSPGAKYEESRVWWDKQLAAGLVDSLI